MAKSAKNLVILTIILAVTIACFGIFGDAGLLRNNRIQSNLNSQLKEIEDREMYDEIQTSTRETVNNQTIVDFVKNAKPEEMKGAYNTNLSVPAKVALIIILCVLLTILPTLLILKQTDGDKEYEKKREIRKENSKKFIDISNNDGINLICKIIKQGGVVIIPCDTIWGICSLANKENISKIQKIKERDISKKLITLCDKQSAKLLFGSSCPNALYDYWPGPLTIIGYRKNNKKDTIAVRVPNDKRLSKIISKTGAIYSTSVNKSGDEPLQSFDEIKKAFGSKVDAIGYDYKLKMNGKPSTIIDVTQNPFRIVREGAIKKEQLKI